jgi:hypothetical protein
MNPYLRIFLRAAAVGLGAALGSLYANLPGVSQDDLLQAIYFGYGGIMSYAGLGAFTTLEPTLGVGAKVDKP